MRITRRWMGALAVLGAGTWLSGCITPPSAPPTSTTQPVSTEQCETERETIETALEATNVDVGQFPATLESMLGIYLDPDTDVSRWTYTSTGATYTLTGDC